MALAFLERQFSKTEGTVTLECGCKIENLSWTSGSLFGDVKPCKTHLENIGDRMGHFKVTWTVDPPLAKEYKGMTVRELIS